MGVPMSDATAMESMTCGCALCAGTRRALAHFAESQQPADFLDAMDAIQDQKAFIMSCPCAPCRAAKAYSDTPAGQAVFDAKDAMHKLRDLLAEYPEELAEVSRRMAQATN